MATAANRMKVSCDSSFPPCTSQKLEVSGTEFFDIVSSHNDCTSPVKHVLGSSWVFFTLFKDRVGGVYNTQRSGAPGPHAHGRPQSGGGWASENRQTTPATTSTTLVRQLLGPLTRTQHPPQPAQPRYTNDWALQTRKRHQLEHRPQQPTNHSDPTQHAKGRTGHGPGPCKETTA